MPVNPIIPDVSPLFRENVRSAVRVVLGAAGETVSLPFAVFAKECADYKVFREFLMRQPYAHPVPPLRVP